MPESDSFMPAVVQPGGTVDLMPEETAGRLYKMAGYLAKSRMFKDVTQAEQAFAKMLVGYHLGLNPSQSMMGIQIVRGNVGMAYPLMGAFVKSRPGYDYKILEHDNDHAKIEFIKDGESLGMASFSVADAERAKLVKPDGGWTTYPENMCVARALSKGIRFFMPEALGGLPVYATDEIPAQDAQELTAGDGNGQAPAVEVDFPPEVEAVIERAKALGHTGWAATTTWTYRVRMGEGPLADSLKEATSDLDAWERTRWSSRGINKETGEITDAEVVEPEGRLPDAGQEKGGNAGEAEEPDVVNPEPAPEVFTDLGGGETTTAEDSRSSADASHESPVAQEVPATAPYQSEELTNLKRKRQIIEEMPAEGVEEQAEKDEVLAYVDAEIENVLDRAGVTAPAGNPQQESML